MPIGIVSTWWSELTIADKSDQKKVSFHTDMYRRWRWVIDNVSGDKYLTTVVPSIPHDCLRGKYSETIGM